MRDKSKACWILQSPVGPAPFPGPIKKQLLVWGGAPKSTPGFYPRVVTSLSWQKWPVLLANLRVQGLPSGGLRWGSSIKRHVGPK